MGCMNENQELSAKGKEERIVAPCGIDCFNCELYRDNVEPERRDRLAAAYNVPKEKIRCEGCYGEHKCLLLDLSGKPCKTLDCIREKGVDYCFQCDEFPCDLLHPLADGAGVFPHNMKLYNLCQMKKLGIEAWADNAAEIRKVYFEKKMAIGEGGRMPKPEEK